MTDPSLKHPRLWRDTHGTVFVLVALTMSALIGLVAFGVEIGFWYAIKRHNQTAADIAAISGAFELDAGQGSNLTANAMYPDICALAKQDAASNGFTFVSFTCPSTTPGCTNPTSGKMCVNNPPATAGSPFLNNPNAVEVILNQQQSSSFASLYLPNVDIATRAVALVQKFDQSCLLALGTTGSDVWLQGSAQICTDPAGNCTGTGTCSIAANSSDPAAINLVGTPSITADTIVTPGGITGHLTNVKLASPAITGAAPVADPYASILTHAALQSGMPNTCTAGPAGNGVFVYNTDVRFCNGLTIGNHQTVDFQPPASGHMMIWITDGDLALTNTDATLECTTCNPATGKEITIILTKGTGAGAIVGGVSMKANATINSLNAPNSGSFSGVLIAQDPAGPFTTPATQGQQCKNVSSPCSTFQGGPSAIFNGLVYFPKTSMEFQGTRVSAAIVACCSWFNRRHSLVMRA